MKPIILSWLCVAMLGLCATQPAHAIDERARIAAEKAQVEASYQRQVIECRSHFVVTACIEQARAQRRADMEPLTQQQGLLDDAERRQRAAQRMQQIRDKTAAADAKPLPTPSVKTPHVRPPTEAASAPLPPADRPSPKAASAGVAGQAAERARRAREFDRKQREAVEHRAEVQRRALAQPARSASASPLPPRPPIPASDAAR